MILYLPDLLMSYGQSCPLNSPFQTDGVPRSNKGVLGFVPQPNLRLNRDSWYFLRDGSSPMPIVLMQAGSRLPNMPLTRLNIYTIVTVDAIVATYTVSKYLISRP
jgi:hypothetical protein